MMAAKEGWKNPACELQQQKEPILSENEWDCMGKNCKHTLC